MATPQERLAEALQALRALQDQGKVAIKSDDLTRTHRERLQRAGFLEPVMRGWYIPSGPEDAGNGETTAWYAAYWDFCAAYLQDRFGDEWSLSPEQSVLLHAGNRSVPRQLMVRAPRARNRITALLHGTDILEVRAAIATGDALEQADGLRIFRLPHALKHSTEGFFRSCPADARAALARIRDASEILPILLEGGHSTLAGRLAAAFRNIGRTRIGEDILKAMRAAGYTVTETNPFDDDLRITLDSRERSPWINRIHTYWASMREQIIDLFPEPPGIPESPAACLEQIDEIYGTDAYHSLSIEGYRVTPELIEQVRSGNWHPDALEADRQHRDAMAARGYWLAFREVKKSVERILDHVNPGTVADEDHGDWYRALFAPSVESGLLSPADLAGYRNDQVYIRNSMHVPVRKEAILDCMPALFDHLRDEPHAAVRTVLGHWIFVYIHPCRDGNGRMGRFLMNAMLASGGYPWTVIPVERRTTYMHALESASVQGEIGPFAALLGDLVRSS